MTKDDFMEYCQGLVNSVPHSEYILLLVIFCIGTVMFLGIFGWKRGLTCTVSLLLGEYCILLISSMVIFREAAKESVCHFLPMWSYYPNGTDVITIMPEHVMNVVVFVFVGFLIGALISLKAQKGWIIAISVGFCFSVMIEGLQYVFNKGICEIDDVMNNTLGCLIGVTSAYIIKKIIVKCNLIRL